jgi:hypothetical protein
MTPAARASAGARSSGRSAIALAGAAHRLCAAGRPAAALAAAQRIDGMPRLRGATLAALAPRLPRHVLRQAAAEARRLPDPWGRGIALAGLLPFLPTPDRWTAVGDVLAAAEALDWLAGDCLLHDLAPRLAAAGDAHGARRVVAAIRDERIRLAAAAAAEGRPPATGTMEGIHGRSGQRAA